MQIDKDVSLAPNKWNWKKKFFKLFCSSSCYLILDVELTENKGKGIEVVLNVQNLFENMAFQ